MVYDICQESPFEFTVYHLCGFQDDVSLFSTFLDGTVCDFTFRTMVPAVLDHSFTDSGIREFSFHDCQVHTIPVFDIINVDISPAVPSACRDNTGVCDSVGFPIRGDTTFGTSNRDFGVSLYVDHTCAKATLDIVHFPAMNHDFMPNSHLSGSLKS